MGINDFLRAYVGANEIATVRRGDVLLSGETGDVPVSTGAPAITGTLQVGQLLTVSDGTWTHAPTGYARRWLRGGTAISGATGATYLLAAEDAGQTITAQVRAANADGPGAWALATGGGAVLPAPVLTLALSPASITAGDTVTVTGAVANGSAAGFSAISASIGEAVQTLSGSGLLRTFTATASGTLSVMASVSVSGQTVSASATATVAPLVVVSPPALSVPIEDIVLTVGDPDLVIDLADHFSGADSYAISPAVAGVSLAGSMLTIDTAAAIATTAITVTASNNDGSTEDTVFVTVSATAPEVLDDVELQRGQPAAFSILIDGAGPVSATHLPIGMVLNPTTGAVTGTPLSWEPETVVTVTRGAATASFKFSVLPKTGIGIIPPTFRSHNIDTGALASLGLWNGQELGATSRATLITSIAAAAADTGTVAAPKYHRITYSGSPIDTDATIGPAGEAWSPDIHTVIVISGLDAAARLTFRGRTGVLICLRGSLLSHGVTCGDGGSLDVFGCRIGPWHRPGAVSFQAANGAPVQAYGGSLSIAACHIAGGFDMLAFRSCRVQSTENYWTHFINDLASGGMNTTGGDALLWRCGDVIDRPAENTGTNNHGDGWQIQTPGTAVNIKVTDQLTVANMPSIRYASTLGREGPGPNYLDVKVEMKGVIYAGTGWDTAVIYSADTDIDGMLGLPAFEVGSSGSRLFFYDLRSTNPPPGSLTLSNIVVSDVIWAGGWADHIAPITGADIRIDVTTDMSGYFPDLTGEVVLDPYGSGRMRMIPAAPNDQLHPYASRAQFEVYEPAAGWASIGQLPMADRRIFPEVWGDQPAQIIPGAAITSAALNATTLTLDVTSSAAEGMVYWYLTPVAGAMSRTAVMQQCDPSGVRYTTETQPASGWTGVLDNKGVAGGHYRFSGGVIPQITSTGAFSEGVEYHLHMLIETVGGRSAVVSQVLTRGEVAPVAARFAVVNNAGPYFVNTGGALGVNSGQITFAFRGSFDADQGAQKFLLALGGTSMMLRLNVNRSLRLTITDGAGNAVLAQTDTATALFAGGVDVDIVLSVDLVAGYARIWVDGVQVMNASLTAGSGTFSETATIYLLSQLVGGAAIPGASVERLTLWKTAAPAGALPVAAPVVDVTGPASAANAHPWKRGADAVSGGAEPGRVASLLSSTAIFSGHSLTDGFFDADGFPGHWRNILASVGQDGFALATKDTIPGSGLPWRWGLRDGNPDAAPTAARSDIADYDLLVITDGGPPPRPDVPGDLAGLKNSADYLFLFVENAHLNGRSGLGAETVYHTINTWAQGANGTGTAAAWGLGFRDTMVAYERCFHWLVDYVSWKMRVAYPALGPDYRVWIAPHHRLWIRMWDAIQAGTMPGYTAISQLFGDEIHYVSDAGYGIACLTFAMLYQQNPAEIAGFYVPSGMSTALRDWLWTAAWEIVTEYSRAGMGGTDEGEPGFDPETDEDPWYVEPPPEPGELPDMVLALTADSYTGPTLTGMPAAMDGYFAMGAGVATGELTLGASRYIAALVRKPAAQSTVLPIVATYSGNNWWDPRCVSMDFNGFSNNFTASQNSTGANAGWASVGAWQFVEVWADGAVLNGAVNLSSLGADATITPMTTTSKLLIGGEPGNTLTVDIAGLWICDHKPTINERAAIKEVADGIVEELLGPFDGAWAGVSFGLSGLADWSTAQPFLNRFKSGRIWAGHAAGEDWGFYPASDLIANGHLDSEYNIVSIPAGVDELGTCIFTEAPAGMTHLAGTYRLTWTGAGTVTVNRPTTVVSTNELTFTYTPPHMIEVRVSAVTPGNPPRDFVLLHQNDIAAYEAGSRFCQVWLSVLGEARQVRFMDWMQTNGSQQVAWANRPKAADLFYTVKGCPVEVMVDLLNAHDIDGWFCIPHMANDAYITAFASYVRDNHTGSGYASFEYSNEFWNWAGGFGQSNWLEAQAIAAGWGSGGDQWMQMGGARFANMAQLINAAFAGHAREDHKRIVFAGVMSEGAALDAPLWLADNPGEAAPRTYVDAYATSGYIDGGFNNANNSASIAALVATSVSMAGTAADGLGLTGPARDAYVLEHRFDHASAQAYQSMLGEDIGLTEPNTGLQGVVDHWQYHYGVAVGIGVTLTMYEGGTHQIVPASLQSNADVVAFYMHFNYSAEMAALYQDAHDAWVDVRGHRYNYFTECEAPGNHGLWGHARFAGDTNPRLAKVHEIAASTLSTQ